MLVTGVLNLCPAAHAVLGSRIDVVLDTLANPSVSGLSDLPTEVGESMGALRGFVAACTP